ncbi:MAG: signal peptidase II [Actinobacteria bacterium]|nr:signal peptidase II [Actinomycetota bacterium]
MRTVWSSDRRSQAEGASARAAVHGLQASRGARSLRLYRPLLLTAAIVVLIDQLTKSWALTRLRGGRSIDIIEGALSLRLTFNPGGAFGFGKEFPEFFLVATIVVIITIVAWVGRTGEVGLVIPLGLVLGGGTGNLVDRLFRGFDGQVVDFIDPHVWPVFNVADSCIVIGVGLVLLQGFIGAGDGEPAGEAGPGSG